MSSASVSSCARKVAEGVACTETTPCVDCTVKRRHRRNAVAIVRRKSFQIGGNARTARRIESRNCQKNRWSMA